MKYKYINQEYWENNLSKKDWYLRLADDFKKYIIKPDEDIKNRKKIKREIYHIVNEFYKQNKLYLGTSGENWDSERKPIEYIVLHHTSAPTNVSLSLLSTVQMIRLYVNQYLLKKDKLKYSNDPVVYGQPLWSNHFRKRKMVFFAYHWLIRSDGSAQRLLQDNEIGWHAGSWPINCASIAICFSGNYENKMPDKKMLDSAVKIIKENYPKVSKKNILGHGETKSEPTACPGKCLGHIKKYIKERL
uniref:N-acetylmuramoyl-L-alanine amidase n=1 Tax=candidate division CPR3 bacterium TaxID=2268181 RepID=A0A7C4M365_UNCC3